MPITPEQIEQNYAKYYANYNIFDKACLEIDSTLGNPVYVKEMVYGGIDDPHWNISFEGSATKQELDAIMDIYLAVGWGRVCAVSYIERNRNMIKVTLHEFKEPIIHL